MRWRFESVCGDHSFLNFGTMKELFDIIVVSGEHTEGFMLKQRTIGFAVTAGLVVIAILANF